MRMRRSSSSANVTPSAASRTGGPPDGSAFQRGGAGGGGGLLTSLRSSLRKMGQSPAAHKLARKASSSGSLRLSPPKVKNSRRTVSNPTSPVSTRPRRAVSTPEELALNRDAVEAGFILPPSGGADDRSPNSSGDDATYRRHQRVENPYATAPRRTDYHDPKGQLANHVYDRGIIRGDLPHQHQVYATMGNSVHSGKKGGDPHGIYQTRNEAIYQSKREAMYQTRREALYQTRQEAIYQSRKEATYQTRQEATYQTRQEALYQSRQEALYQSRQEALRQQQHQQHMQQQYQQQHRDPVYQTRHEAVRGGGGGGGQGAVQNIYESIDHGDRNNEKRRLSKPELRQFSREPTVLKLSDHAGRDEEDKVDYPINKIEDDLDHIQITVKEAYNKDGRDKDRELPSRNNGRKTPMSPPRKSQSSSSPEWPPPPDPITSPQTPASQSGAVPFDSSTLKRMLRGLPNNAEPNGNSSNSENSSGNENNLQQGGECVGKPEEAGVARPRDTQPSPQQQLQQQQQHEPRPLPARPQRYTAGEAEYTHVGYKTMSGAHSYPDGAAAADSRSVQSGNTARSQSSERASKSATLPPGMGLSGYAGSKSGSSGSSQSGSHRHSEILRHLGSGSETTEIRQLTSSDISDSEEQETSSDGGTSDSSIHTMPSESQASFASKSHAVRKAGWLNVKNWLIHKKRKVELASKRTWKKYWVCLKGTMLLFYQCDEGETVDEHSVPRHMLVIEGGIAQAVPEHPKRELIFALSTAFGDAYLFQATSQIELENWVSAIHSACASSFARQHGRENTLKLLKSEIQSLENSIDIDIKMKKMADLQLTVVSDPRSKQAIEKQIAQWDENLEKLYIEQFRLRCYVSSLQGSELPNPKNVLSVVAKATKASLGKIGVFTVTSFHAMVCARTPLTHATMYGNKSKKRGLLSTFKADSVTKLRPKSPRSFNSPQGGNEAYRTSQYGDHVVVDLAKKAEGDGDAQKPADSFVLSDNLVRISLPNGTSIVLGISDKMTVQEVLEATCNKRQLNPNDHFLRFKLHGADSYRVPEKSVYMEHEEYEHIEVCGKILFQIELLKSEKDADFGMAVEAELAEDADEEDELCVFISDLAKNGLALRKGLIIGDEILVINGKVVSDLDMVFVETLLCEATSLCLTIRSCRVERPVNTTAMMEHADMYIDNLMCPPPPSQSRISDKSISQLIVPAPGFDQTEGDDGQSQVQRANQDVAYMSAAQIDNLLQGAEQVTHFCRLLHQHQPLPDAAMGDADQLPPQRPLSDSQKLRKVILELIDTERCYVKDLNCLIERYLEPLKEETFLSGEDTQQLFGNIQEIVQFQHMFLQSLEEAVQLEPNFSNLAEPNQFRRILFSLGGSFLHYANHFKLYSSFCASHSKAQKVLNPDTNPELREFLRARNPKQQHSSTLESYLIKPIQRILKYPLLLQQLKYLTDPHTDEHHHLSEALRGMEAVAEHINEMQKIYEEYGSIFDDLIKQYRDYNPQRRGIDLNVGDLQMYGTVSWLNALDEIGKIKKGIDLVCTLFVFKSGVVLLAQERIKGKKKPKPQGNKQQSSPESGDTTRYQMVVPVDQLQVRSSGTHDTHHHGFWELVHCKSETEGRPEKTFQLASSLGAKNDFMKTIRNIIRESVRRMSLPTTRVQVGNKGAKLQQQPPLQHQRSFPQQQQHQPHEQQQQHFLMQTGPMLAQHGTKRPDNLPGAHKMGGPWTMDKKARGKQLKSDMVRHSVDMDDRVNAGAADTNGDLRTRSRTFSDLNVQLVGGSGDSLDGYPSGSQSTLSSDRGAKLLHASNRPENYNSNSNLPVKDSLGSPIWKPRHYQQQPHPHHHHHQQHHHHHHHHHPQQQQPLPPPQQQQQQPAQHRKPYLQKSPHSVDERTLEAAIFSGSAYGDYSNVIYDEGHGAVLLPNTHVEHEDTEC